MIMARITIDGKVAQFSTKQSVLPANWNVEAGKVKGKDAGKINALLDDVRSSLNKIYHDQQRDNYYVTTETVKNEFLGYRIKQETVLALFNFSSSSFFRIEFSGYISYLIIEIYDFIYLIK